jgi:hypothetical protein
MHDTARSAASWDVPPPGRQPDQPAAQQFSNFSRLENRETHEPEPHATTYDQDDKSLYTADNYQDTLTLKR